MDGGLIAVGATAGLTVAVYAARQFVAECTGKRPKVIGVTHTEMGAAIAQFQDSVISPLRDEVREAHGCIDGMRDDIKNLQLQSTKVEALFNRARGTLHKISNAVTSLSGSLERIEAATVQMEKRITRLEDRDDRMRAAAKD